MDNAIVGRKKWENMFIINFFNDMDVETIII